MSEPSASPDDVEAVAALLGRRPSGRFAVVVRRRGGAPAVIENAPHLEDGTPMPTLLWLVDPSLREQVSRIESEGGVRRIEALVDPEHLEAVHAAHAAARTESIIRTDRPAPSGGVGGTRRGLKCLHAHLASWLAGFDDPAGALVAMEIDLRGVERTDRRAGSDV
jgi:hypothetical protein